LFIGITAAATGVGRFFDGEFPMHYTTPALLAWTALIVLGAPSFSLRRAVGIFACAAILLFPSQIVPVFGLRHIAVTHDRMQQAMQAILHGSDDPETLGILTGRGGEVPPDARLGLDVVRRLRGTKISIFADKP
jgi:hypothetical protein